MSEPAGTAGPPAPEGPDEQQRLRRADRATKGALAGVLGLEAIVALLVPRALAFTDEGLATYQTVSLVVLAVLMIVAAAMLRRPFGVGLGTALQVVFLLAGIWLIALLVIAAIFAAVWLRLLFLRTEIAGTPRGMRMLVS